MSFKDEFWMGPGTHKIKIEMYELNRERLLKRLRAKNQKNWIVFLQGSSYESIYGTDNRYIWKQDSFLLWAFGIQETDCYGGLDVDTGKSVGFFRQYKEESIIYNGEIKPLEFFKNKYKLDEVYYSNDIATVLNKFLNPILLTLKGVNTDSGLPVVELTFEGIENFAVNTDVLFQEMCYLRTIKTKYEIEVMRYVCGISSEGHKKMMKFIKPGKYQYQCEAEFLNYCFSVGGCRSTGYDCIGCSGENNAILHYGHGQAPNDMEIKDGEMVLFDMGALYFGFSADITCSYPVNGKFTPNQKIIYEAVLAACLAVADKAKPGVSWECMHLLANSVMLKKLKEGGLLKGEVEDMMAVDLGYIFQPHGLGHLLGMDVHDVGGYLEGYTPRPTRKSTCNLRMARNLEEGMVITIEPGCYFINFLLDEAFSDQNLSKFLVKDVINRFRAIGGVRIEDDVLITKTGVEYLHKVPRTVNEIEEYMAKTN